MKKRAERIAKLVAAKTGRATKVVEVEKNNFVCCGVGIETDKKGTYVVAHLNEEDCCDEEIADEIVNSLNKDVLNPDIDVKKTVSKDYILENVFPCFVGVNGNEKLLEEHPNVRFLDMAILFRVNIEEFDGSYLLTNSNLDAAKINVPEIFDIARKNMVEKHKAKIVPTEYVILHNSDTNPENDIPETECRMAVMTNKDKFYGANAFLRKDILKKYADKIGKNLYIIPSSVHEFLIIPEDVMEVRYLKMMVQDVNNCIVEKEEVLTYSVYEYNREHNEISVAP